MMNNEDERDRAEAEEASENAEHVVKVVRSTFRITQVVLFGVFVLFVSILPFILDTIDQTDDFLPYTFCCVTNLLFHGPSYLLYSIFGGGHVVWIGYAYWPMCYLIFLWITFSRLGGIMFIKTSFWFTAIGLNLLCLGLSVMIGIPGFE
jgi:hypothetical protein